MGDTGASGQGSCEVPEASLLSSDPPLSDACPGRLCTPLSALSGGIHQGTLWGSPWMSWVLSVGPLTSLESMHDCSQFGN